MAWLTLPWLTTLACSAELAARVVAPVSGRAMELFTNQPGVQFYTGAAFWGGTLTVACLQEGSGWVVTFLAYRAI